MWDKLVLCNGLYGVCRREKQDFAGAKYFVRGDAMTEEQHMTEALHTNETGHKIGLDKWDYTIAIASGALTGLLDVFWVKDINLFAGREWGQKQAERLIQWIARKQGYTGDDDKAAIRFLEKQAPMVSDGLTNQFGGARQHHLRDFAHHPTPVGLTFSILTQFTGHGYGTDTEGNLIAVRLESDDLIGKNFAEKMYNGVVSWLLHLVSDMAGSSSSAAKQSDGTGIPGPALSFIKELSVLPGIKHLAGTNEQGRNRLSVASSKLFNGTYLARHNENGIEKTTVLKFDLRTEMGLVHEAIKTKQYIPVLVNEIIVRGFYAVRRFIEELEKVEDIDRVDMKKVLPFNNVSLKHMLTISTVTFSVIDISGAGIKAAIKNRGNKSGFALDFLQGINYIAIVRMLVSVGGEAGRGVEKLYDSFIALTENSAVYQLAANTWDTTTAVQNAGTPVGFITAVKSIYEQIEKALEEKQLAHEERLRIEAEVKEHIRILTEQRVEVEAVVTEYMEQHLEVFGRAFSQMEKGIAENETDQFIGGNHAIQQLLGRQNQFSNQSEFDILMDLKEDFKL